MVGVLPDSAVEEQLSGGALLAWRRSLLAQGGDAAQLDWLLDLAGGVDARSRLGIRLDRRRPVSLRRSRQQLADLWHRHQRDHTPLQYLAGRCPWRDLELGVGPGVLIPRPETELLVDLAVAVFAGPDCVAAGRAPSPPRTPLRWADLGTGSGCLAVGLAQAFPTSSGVAVDCSPQALQQTEANLLAADVSERVALGQGSWWEPLQPWWGQLDLVVSNPPYIPTALLSELDPIVRLHEPWLALDGGHDGLHALRAITADAAAALAPGGWLLLEHHHDQREPVLALLKGAGLLQPSSFQDLEGHWRFCGARRSRALSPAPLP